jgi:hypothetical protein
MASKSACGMELKGHSNLLGRAWPTKSVSDALP